MKHSWLAPWLGAAFFFLAVTSALYYHGFIADFFCVTQALLLLWLLSALWRGGREGIPLPRSALALLLVAYADWLALTLTWGTVPNYNIVTFWGLGSLPLVFWLCVTNPEREALWYRAAVPVLLLALALSVLAAYQMMAKAVEPKSVFLDLNSHAAFIALIALPTAGYFLAAYAGWHGNGARRWRLALGAAVFVLVFAVAITAGRGAFLVLVTGMGVLVVVAWWRKLRRPAALLAVISVVALVAGNLAARGRATERLVTLVDPAAAGWGRFMIWEQAWNLIKESPWLGKGLGTFGLVFPSRQHPLDGSAGFMVHNDYLQLWLEAGLPGLVLLLAIYVSTLVLFIRVLRSDRYTTAQALEITGLFSGLLAIAMHSFINFNLYVLPTSLIAGVMLARFHELAAEGLGARIWKFNPTRYLRPLLYRAVILVLTLVGIGYWTTQMLANYAFQDATRLVQAGELDRADAVLSRARWLSPDSEMVLVARAELYRHVIAAAPASAAKDKRQLFQSAMEALDHAEKLNPYRADIPFLRARLKWLMKSVTGDGWKEQTVRGYEQASRLQPRFYTARVELAAFWLEQGEPAKAREVLEQGMAYEYVGQERILPYYRLTAALRRQAGDIDGARQLEQRIADILSVPPERRPLPLDQVKFFSFYDLWRWFLRLLGWA